MAAGGGALPSVAAAGDVEVPSVAAAATAATATPAEIAAETRCAAQFPNAFLIHGIKHVCDNAMKSILPSMTMCPG